jgi:hypothetical protein
MKKLGLLALPALLAPLFASTASSSAATPPDPAALPRGADPAVVWMSGRTVHTAHGRAETLPLPASHATSLRLLGRRHGTWIVFDNYGATVKVLAVKGPRVRTIWRHVVYDPGTVYALERGGDEIVQWFTDRGDRTSATVFDLRGHHVATRTFGAGSVLDFADETLVLGFRKTVAWRPGSAPVPVAGGASWADAARDVLFVDDADYDTGPTALSAPGVPAWTASFLPRAISPDGAWVAGLSGTRLVVRSMATGAKAPVSGLRLARQPALAWEPDGTLLAQVHGPRGEALARCTTEGVCERATDWAGPTLSFPDQGQYFENY